MKSVKPKNSYDKEFIFKKYDFKEKANYPLVIEANGDIGLVIYESLNSIIDIGGFNKINGKVLYNYNILVRLFYKSLYELKQNFHLIEKANAIQKERKITIFDKSYIPYKEISICPKEYFFSNFDYNYNKAKEYISLLNKLL